MSAVSLDELLACRHVDGTFSQSFWCDFILSPFIHSPLMAQVWGDKTLPATDVTDMKTLLIF